MKVFIGIIIIISVAYSADLNVRIIPDTIYVGSLATINISVIDMQPGEYPVFYDIAELPDMYSLVERILNDNSADYTLQFWESGLINIPSITVDIRRNKHNVAKLQTDIIEITILSSMRNYNGSTRDNLRDIKPLQEVIFMDAYKVLLYILFLIMGMLLAIYFWKYRKESQVLIDSKGDYNKSRFQETIRCLELLQIPNNINEQNTEKYYLELSNIFRTFIKEEYFIRATEMTTDELEIYFQSIGIHQELIHAWSKICKFADMAKYAGQIPEIDQFNKDREDFIKIIKSFHNIEPHILYIK